ncbi:MAG TPA: hypothetical protein VN436_05225, partial [Holophaga sp.]|nr:hypothetical protein [Holophaga sp.]
AGTEGTWVGFGRQGLGLDAPDDPGEGPGTEEPEQGPPPAPAEPPDCLLWMLCGRDDTWLLETLTEQNHATYRFAGGEGLPHLASQLLCAPHFSREALYKPLESLQGELAIPARDLAFLKELRARFRGRAIHGGLDRWKREAGIG